MKAGAGSAGGHHDSALTMEQQKAFGLKSLPRATITPASSMSLARGCGSLKRPKVKIP